MITNRASKLLSLSILAFALAAGPAALAQVGKPPLTLVSYGGVYTRSQMLAYVLPYREQRDRWVTVEDHEGGLDEIREQVRALNVTWDLVTLELPEAIEGCREGLLEPIDPTGLAPAPDGTPARADFYDPALQRCAVGSDIFATVVAYDRRRYGDRAPATLADFFDPDRFPGPRGLRLRPEVNLEWALIADGVPAGEIYDVLSTEQGLERAFAVLDRIRDSIVWWREGGEPPQLLASGQVAMTSAWNGRIHDEIETRGTPLAIVWDHQVWNMDVWAIARGAPNRAEALEFIAFATTPERMAEQAGVIPYGPARRSALELIPADVRANLPTAEGRRESAVIIDYTWWAERRAAVQARFDAWLRGEDRFTYDFNPPDAP
jgi:putative spermidine/putrescine transport system substrate-binding protein